ncbi:MAG TPA: hypothetical protein PLH33_05955, partial [Chitinophagaceae bacterium]|nr:hypothetical protein [Chitinophagaceae bacterium]
MKVVKKLFFTLSFIMPALLLAQSSYLTLGGKEEWLLNRMEIKTNANGLSFSSLKPFNRKYITNTADYWDSLYTAGNKNATVLTSTDKYNLQRFLMANSEWSKPKEIFKSEKPIWKYFFHNRSNMIELQNSDFVLIANPILQYEQGSKGGNSKSTFINKRGINVRGLIGTKIGFHFYFTENQERLGDYVAAWKNKFIAYPGAGYIKNFKTGGYDYFDIRGGLSWKVAKFMDMQLAYDRNFIGNGYRSLFLSDFSTNYMYFKVYTHFGKFQFQNIFAELVSYKKSGSDRIYPRKYFRASYLNFKATKWLNLGLFEGLMLADNSAVSLPLFNPIMFTNVSGNKNDKSYIGFDVKANIAKRFQLYGQLMIDKLKTDELKNDWWGNRFAYQAGLKYTDAFGIKNLDVQVETNVARPFTYAANDSVTSYNHYNQPLAHPLGANFRELLIDANYKLKRFLLSGTFVMATYGADSTNSHWGKNIYKSD